MSDTFFLQPDVFLCRTKRHWVILDVNRDKYLCVDGQQLESLGPWLHGWEGTVPCGAEAASALSPPREAIALANKLLSLQILSEHAGGAKEVRGIVYPHPTDAVDPDVPAHTRRSPYTHALTFFLSSATASRQLRDKGFQATISRVRARKRGKVDSSRPFDSQRARSLISVFGSLRWFYPRPYLCLFDSLALIEFLAHFNLYPDWVFGVTADPFEAHCWVQSGGVVLNDTIERVSAFTPIMYV